jgi:hypothetical protein
MFAVVDTFNKPHGDFGTVISRHWTLDAAVKAENKFQAQVRRNNGNSSYIPTVLVHLMGNRMGRVGQSIPCDWVENDGRWEQIDRPCREVARQVRCHEIVGD